MIGFLNLAVVGLILSTFTTRFIFPMISLEGRRLWILGLLPIRRDAILWSKFIFAAVGSLIPCMTLVLLSDLMLQIQFGTGDYFSSGVVRGAVRWIVCHRSGLGRQDA